MGSPFGPFGGPFGGHFHQLPMGLAVHKVQEGDEGEGNPFEGFPDSEPLTAKGRGCGSLGEVKIVVHNIS